MPIALALYQPDIAQNTGAMLRLCACLDAPIHIIHPTGFPFSRAALRRTGLDYIETAETVEHAGFAQFSRWCREEQRRIVLLSTKARASAYAFSFTSNDVILMGRESAGVPEAVADRADAAIRIPMHAATRSLNVALAAAMILGEAKRQTDQFESLS